MTMIGKDFPVRANAFCLSSEKRVNSAAMSPAETLCFDIFSPLPGDSDVMGDGVSLVEPRDIIGEAADFGEAAGIFAKTRGVLAQRNGADMVRAVFDAPVFANGGGGLRGADRAVGQIERSFG